MWRVHMHRRRWQPLLLVGGLIVVAGMLGAALLGPVTGRAQQGAGVFGSGMLAPTVPLERAQEIARDGHGDAVVRQVGLETEQGRLVYEVTLSDGAEVVVDAMSEAVVATEHDADDARRQPGTSGSAPSAGAPFLRPVVGLAQAQQIALAATVGAAVKELELESADGALFYELDLSGDVDVTIDAATGAIREIEQDDDD